MKYMIRVLISCAMLLGLCACGGGQEKNAVADVSVQSVLDEMLTKAEVEEPLILTEGDMLDFFGIKGEDMAEFAAVTCSNGISAQEIVLVKAVNESSAEAIEEKLENRLENRMAEFKDYLPEQYDILTECDVEQEGVYVCMILHPQHEMLEELYDGYFDKD